MLSDSELQDQVAKAVSLYNRFHSPEATAKIVRVTLELVTVAFSGSFCYSCGVMDFLDDFARQFKILTDKAELKIDHTRHINLQTFEADFRVKHR